VIVVGEIVCVIYGRAGMNKLLITETRAGNPSSGTMASRGTGGGSMALLHGKEGQSIP
jgi:hypothetical protein